MIWRHVGLLERPHLTTSMVSVQRVPVPDRRVDEQGLVKGVRIHAHARVRYPSETGSTTDIGSLHDYRRSDGPVDDSAAGRQPGDSLSQLGAKG